MSYTYNTNETAKMNVPQTFLVNTPASPLDLRANAHFGRVFFNIVRKLAEDWVRRSGKRS